MSEQFEVRTFQSPGVLSGLLEASMVTAALIGALFFGWSVAGLPFVPFDVFDWLSPFGLLDVAVTRCLSFRNKNRGSVT